jgi:HK97 family phage major capsid protein
MNKEVETLMAEAKELKERAEKAATAAKEAEVEKANAVAGAGFPAVITGNRSFSMESKAMAHFGVSSPAKLLEINTAHPRFAGVPEESKAVVRELKKRIDTARWIAQVFHGAPTDRDDNHTTAVKNIGDTYFARNELIPYLKAFGSTVSNGGDEWVPTALSSQYIEEFHLDRKVLGLFKQIQMPTNPFELPISNSYTTAKIVAENSAATAQNFGTSKLTFSATKLYEYMILPEELNEDSAPAIMELIKAQVLESQGRAQEQYVINGDTAGTHQDSDVTSAADARKLCDGLRKLALANSANGSTVSFAGAVTTAKLDAMRTAMGKFGVNPRDLVLIVGPDVYSQMLGLAEVSTVEKFGPQATILSGALAAFRGSPIVVSEFSREDLNASGVYDGTTTTKASALMVHKARFYDAVRRPIKVKVQPDLPNQDRWLMASYQRVDFKGMPQSASEVSVVLGYNITK